MRAFRRKNVRVNAAANTRNRLSIEAMFVERVVRLNSLSVLLSIFSGRKDLRVSMRSFA